MRTVGQVLKQTREEKFYTLEEVEKATKIRKELLEALEQGQYKKLPPPTFVQGFIKNYGKFLGLDSEKLLAVFRREFSDQKNPPRILDSFINPIDNNRFRITPTKVISTTIFALISIFFIYLWFEYRFLVGAPFLQVDQPRDLQTTSSDNIQIIGKTDPEAKVSINNQEISVDANGRFVQEIKLTETANKITITSISKSNKTSKIERTVFLKI